MPTKVTRLIYMSKGCLQDYIEVWITHQARNSSIFSHISHFFFAEIWQKIGKICSKILAWWVNHLMSYPYPTVGQSVIANHSMIYIYVFFGQKWNGSKNRNFGQKIDFFPKLEILVINWFHLEILIKKSKFWLKIEILVKIDDKSKFWAVCWKSDTCTCKSSKTTFPISNKLAFLSI